MKKCVVTGAAGFTGANLAEALLQAGYFVYCVVRHGSKHNKRLESLPNIHLVYADLSEYKELAGKINDSCELFFHLAWQGKRHDFAAQYLNIGYTIDALEAASKMGARRFVATGSQAEYGPRQDMIREDDCCHPVDAYGASKLSACVLTRQRAAELGIDWIWGRIFSLYGKYEPAGRMLPDLVASLRAGKDFYMQSDGRQNWDYLDVADGARALVALGERGRNGEIYNIASGIYRPLRCFVEDVLRLLESKAEVIYKDKKAAFSLQADIGKLSKDTGWKREKVFMQEM